MSSGGNLRFLSSFPHPLTYPKKQNVPQIPVLVKVWYRFLKYGLFTFPPTPPTPPKKCTFKKPATVQVWVQVFEVQALLPPRLKFVLKPVLSRPPSRKTNLYATPPPPRKKTALWENYPLCPQARPPQKRKFYFYCLLAASDKITGISD